MRTSSRAAVVLAVLACLGPGSVGRAEDAPPPASVGLDLAGMDRTVAPGDDFFLHANGTWLKRTEIPPDRGAWGAFSTMIAETQRQTAALIREVAAAQAPAGSDRRRIADLYASLMDEEGIEKKGLAPLQPALRAIAGIADRKALSRALGERVRADVDVFNATDLHTPNLLGVWVAQDLDEPTRYSPFLVQGGLDMPDRAYYLDPSPRMAELRGKFQAHVAAVLKLAGLDDVETRAARVVALETRMAGAHWTLDETGEIKKGNNHWERADLEKKAPGLDWQEFLTAAGLGEEKRFVVWQPSAVTGLSALVASEPLEAWKDYLVFHDVDQSADFLPRAFAEERFAFHGRVLTGIPAQQERWKRAVDGTNVLIGDAVGKLYLERHFPPAAQRRVEEMVANLLSAFGKRIDALDWMSPATKAQARAKLAVMKVGVGGPRSWTDYAGLEIAPDDALGNVRRASLHHYRQSLRRLGRPVDRGEWFLTPQTVNALNLPALNAMNYPAAILQPPFFDPARPTAMDYGAIGAVIGHEISHSFDDQGAAFDETGRLRNWWTPEDLAHFQAATARLVKQYDAYRPLPDLSVNGSLTLGENIADVAGLAVAHDAWRASLKGRPAPVVEGLTGDQQFFLAFAQAWRVKMREAALRQRLVGDSHSPGQYRAATVRNLDAWYEVFGVKPGQALYLEPKDRVRIW